MHPKSSSQKSPILRRAGAAYLSRRVERPRWRLIMTPTKTLCASLAAISVAALFVATSSPSAYALDPGFGVGRPGPGVYRRAPVARAALVRPVARPVARAAVAAPVARAAVVTPAAPVAAAAVATPAAPVAAAAVTAPAPVAAATVRGGRVVVVNSMRVYRPVVRGGRRVVVVR